MLEYMRAEHRGYTFMSFSDQGDLNLSSDYRIISPFLQLGAIRELLTHIRLYVTINSVCLERLDAFAPQNAT